MQDNRHDEHQARSCEWLRFLRVVPDEPDQEREDHAADRATADVPNPPLDRLPRDRADELADDAAADRAGHAAAQAVVIERRIKLPRGAPPKRAPLMLPNPLVAPRGISLI